MERKSIWTEEEKKQFLKHLDELKLRANKVEESYDNLVIETNRIKRSRMDTMCSMCFRNNFIKALAKITGEHPYIRAPEIRTIYYELIKQTKADRLAGGVKRINYAELLFLCVQYFFETLFEKSAAKYCERTGENLDSMQSRLTKQQFLMDVTSGHVTDHEVQSIREDILFTHYQFKDYHVKHLVLLGEVHDWGTLEERYKQPKEKLQENHLVQLLEVLYEKSQYQTLELRDAIHKIINIVNESKIHISKDLMVQEKL